MNNKAQDKRIVIQAQGIAPGIARGKAFIYRDILSRDILTYDLEKEDVADEYSRIETAIDHVSDDIEKMRKKLKGQSDGFDADIFNFHNELLKDGEIISSLKEEMKRELINAEQVVRNVFRKAAHKLKKSENEIISSKSDDIEDVSRRVLRVLLGYEWNILEEIPPNSIVVAERLLPSDTVHLKRENLKGIVVREGSKHSHSAILARSFGITAVAGVDLSLKTIAIGDGLIVDGQEGTVIVRPNKNDIIDFQTKQKKFEAGLKGTVQKTKNIVRTKDGTHIPVYANASTEEDFKAAAIHGLEGVGLLRLEQLYLSYKSLPEEDMIVEKLSSIFKQYPKVPVTIRLLDIGGDKKTALSAPQGRRKSFFRSEGVRFLLQHQDILKVQIRAIFKLNQDYDIRLLIPMVTLAEEIQQLKGIIEQCRLELSTESGHKIEPVEVGAMIETPAAFVSVSQIVNHVEFVSIGTNDLVQYFMVAGRENMDVAHYYEEGEKLIIGIIEQIMDNVKAKTDVTVCGEMAANVQWVNQLLKVGVRKLSVSPYSIGVIKREIEQIQL